MENKEIREINVEKELPKTLEEYVIKEIESYKKMNANLVEAIRIERNLNHKRNEEIETLKFKFIELINNLKEDFGFELDPYATNECTTQCISVKNSHIWDGYGLEEKFAYYKKIFNLKEEGEEENEQ